MPAVTVRLSLQVTKTLSLDEGDVKLQAPEQPHACTDGYHAFERACDCCHTVTCTWHHPGQRGQSSSNGHRYVSTLLAITLLHQLLGTLTINTPDCPRILFGLGRSICTRSPVTVRAKPGEQSESTSSQMSIFFSVGQL